MEHNTIHWKKDRGIADGMLGISYRDHMTNEEVKTRIENAIGPSELGEKTRTEVYVLITRTSGPAKTILQGTVQGWRQRGRQRKQWEGNIREWTGLG